MNGESNVVIRIDDPAAKELLRRVEASPSLHRAERLRELLAFLAEWAASHPAGELREEEIGVRVFGREQGYDTSHDTIARVQIAALRRKLESYFRTEGAAESLILEIPRGGYRPIVRTRPTQPTVDKDQPPGGRLPSTSWRIAAVALMLVCLILAGALAIAVQRLSTTRGPVDAAGEDSPWTGALWSDLIQDNRTTALVLADPTLVLAQNAMRSSISLQEYTARGLRPRIESGIADPELRDMVRTVISWQVASLADVDLLRRILIMRPITPRQFTVYMARDFNLRLLATGNTILVGGRRSNPWVESFYDSLTFHVEHDESTQLPYILNRSPRPNEQKEYRQDALVGSPRTYGYASVAYIRSPGSSGSVLLLSGTDGQASESAVRFVTTERLFMAFCRTIASTPRRRLPYFEVLLRNEKVSSSPMNVTPIAWRVH